MNATESYEIRRARAEDAHTLAELGATTFTDTFGHLYAPEDLHAYLSTAHSVEYWSQAIADPQSGIWLAERAGQPADGYALVGPCTLPVENLEPRAGEIKRIYVRASAQNARLGTRLLKTSLEWLQAQAYSPLYVGVWSQNLGAQRLYARFGFEKVGEYGFPVGRQIDHEFILKQRAPGSRTG